MGISNSQKAKIFQYDFQLDKFLETTYRFWSLDPATFDQTLPKNRYYLEITLFYGKKSNHYILTIIPSHSLSIYLIFKILGAPQHFLSITWCIDAALTPLVYQRSNTGWSRFRCHWLNKRMRQHIWIFNLIESNYRLQVNINRVLKPWREFSRSMLDDENLNFI